jgi:hypothetical protein
MKTIPILVITNALALGLAIFVYVKQGENAGSARRSDARSDTSEVAELRRRIDELELAARTYRPHPTADAMDDAAAPSGATKGAPARAAEGEAPLASPPPADPAADPGATGSEDFEPQEMEIFRRKVRKANDLNQEEEQKKGIVDGIDRLVKDNKIAPLTPSQKESVANTVMASRRKGMDVWKKLREAGTLEGANRESRGLIIRTEMETLRSETQRALEDIMPAADAKTYLDETLRDQMRFGGFDRGAPQAPAVPAPAR